MDEPLAPIQPEDLVEVVDGDDDDQDEGAASNATPGPLSRDVSEPAPGLPAADGDGGVSKPATPKPHPLSISFQPPTPTPAPDDVDDARAESLRPPEEPEGEDGGAEDTDQDGQLAQMSLDMGAMGPDGEAFEGVSDLSQLQQTDALLGGPMMDEAMVEDPFAVPPS